MSPRARYQQDLDAGIISADPAQADALSALENLHVALADAARARAGLGARLRAWWRPPEPLSGLYLWGGVGRGKTYLMDIFYEALERPDKLRSHFHRFMQRIHHDLKVHKGQPDPLDKVAAELAAEAGVLCLDEFHVSDIGDAMLLAGLLEGLLARRVVLVTTSNTAPERLYEDGLQRARFLPAIALIQRHCRVVEMVGAVDYRFRHLTHAPLYHWPLNAAAHQALTEGFARLAADPRDVREGGVIEVLGREIPARQMADGVIWFDFSTLCGGPRSAFDYVEIARIHHSVVLSDVPRLDDPVNDQVRRFINLVDEFYDRNVKLLVSAAVPLSELYQGQLLAAVFERTRSRLQEMQTPTYLARPHRA